ncbi:META domain-containing protein [Cetobacterium sp. SF1]|uniref:META domain-containing protein n=1 Tax=Cetobacterium sp. SF1 TaxID=3417654 RepID=UPI003CE7E834
MKKISFILLATAILLGGCSSNTVRKIEGEKYKSDTVLYQNSTIEFLKDNKFAGNAGINNYFGNYKLNNDSNIKLEVVGNTLMAGPEAEMNLEKEYIKTLGTVDAYKIDGNYLHFYSKGIEVLKFIKE